MNQAASATRLANLRAASRCGVGNAGLGPEHPVFPHIPRPNVPAKACRGKNDRAAGWRDATVRIVRTVRLSGKVNPANALAAKGLRTVGGSADDWRGTDGLIVRAK
jgi:hypothetical protein